MWPGKQLGLPESGPRSVARIGRREFSRCVPRQGACSIRGAIERLIMVNDDHAISGQVHVEFKAIGASRHAQVERREGVLGAERTAAPVREDLRPPRSEERFRWVH